MNTILVVSQSGAEAREARRSGVLESGSDICYKINKNGVKCLKFNARGELLFSPLRSAFCLLFLGSFSEPSNILVYSLLCVFGV